MKDSSGTRDEPAIVVRDLRREYGDVEVYSVRSNIRPGNSGGPMVSPDGEVLGVVFAASVTDPSTGYVLTADQVSAAAVEGISNTDPVSSGSCT